MLIEIIKRACSTPRQPTIRRFARTLLGAIVIGNVFATGIGFAAEEKNRMDLTEKGHGLLYSGEARAKVNVPDEIADYIWGLQDMLQTLSLIHI